MTFQNSPILGKYVEVPSLRVETLQESAAKAEELRAAYARIVQLESALNDCLEYFEDRYDVNDGDYGEPSPNKEMQLGTMIDELLNGRPF